MKFLLSISYTNISYRSLFFIFVLFTVQAAKLQAETVYITDSLLVGLHEEKSIDSAILKVLPTGTTLEVIKRDNEFVNVRDPKGVTGWVSSNYLIRNNPYINAGSDAKIGQSKRVRELEAELHNIRMQLTKPDKWHVIDPGETAKLKKDNIKLNQQLLSNKLKSGEMQAKLAELRNQISQSGSNNKNANKIRLLTKTNAQLKEKIKQLQTSSQPKISISDNLNISNPLIVTVIALFIGLLIGIIFMDWRARQRHGGLRF